VSFQQEFKPSSNDRHKKSRFSYLKRLLEFGAEKETRTPDPNLGKVMLYQLSYFRMNDLTDSSAE
jgi:hypothetical protein|tara:strand:- start:272 stop:466 length:195 start_codon:yes stop_codon:yes gene_type:complete